MTEVVHVTDTPGAAEAVGEVIATAFHPGAAQVWAVPPEDIREQVCPPYFAMFAEHAFTYGDVYATSDMSAVGVWFRNTEPYPDPPNLVERAVEIAGPYAERLLAVGDALAARHPHGEPHHYLNFLAVLPGHQGKGLGALLLDAHHGAVDKAGLPAYLEASSLRSRAFYLRHGYHDLGDPIDIPNGGPPMYPMWRPAQS
ncbi:Acetyltransferase (GNAT) domain-containing protein [Sinosporangium album]|uniref:Acetyltransferase (GNAT) domain-containing protein n=1 Tax=Sinosporangium album TaxID=504805 RepID=A0A1G8DYL9_9ACTN|nr:GNAT family N-acetyltransferase [Sinosporangium album]SDH62665.1 Acetyltransferase (GNAT) domain-containing protein [Sinosporangium album]